MVNSGSHIRLGIAVCLMLVAATIFSGCVQKSQSLILDPIILRFDTPEVMGRTGALAIDARASFNAPSYDFGSISDYYAWPGFIVDTKESVAKQMLFDMTWHIGLLESVDIAILSEPMIQVKWQLLGEPRNSNEPGVRLALAAGVGYGDGGVLFGSNRRLETTLRDLTSRDGAKVKQTTEAYDLSIMLGYRHSPYFLWYLNGFTSRYDTNGTLSWVSTNAGVTGTMVGLTRKRTSRTFGLLAGINIRTGKKGIYCTLESGIAKTFWPGLGTQTSTPIGLSLGYSWN